MFTLATDVQKIIMEFLEPQEIKELYESCNTSKVMFEELTKHTNFIVEFKKIISDEELKWFKLRNIRLKLLETYDIDGYGNQYWYQNGKIHRDKDLPAVICANGTQQWFQNGKVDLLYLHKTQLDMLLSTQELDPDTLPERRKPIYPIETSHPKERSLSIYNVHIGGLTKKEKKEKTRKRKKNKKTKKRRRKRKT
jgi:hypothetical protein